MADLARIATAEVSVDTGGGDDYLAWMTDADIARFRIQAKECQLQAERSIRTTDREAWRSGLSSRTTQNVGGRKGRLSWRPLSCGPSAAVGSGQFCYGVVNTSGRVHISNMSENVPIELLEVTVKSIRPVLWKWRVCDRDAEIAYGYEMSRETAQIRGDGALFRLLSRGLR